MKEEIDNNYGYFYWLDSMFKSSIVKITKKTNHYTRYLCKSWIRHNGLLVVTKYNNMYRMKIFRESYHV